MAKDYSGLTLKVGTSFLSDYFAHFDNKFGSVDIISVDDQNYPSSKDYTVYENLPYVSDYFWD
eukprot:CAMPEP_0168610324 /NCGR_PEP_ID=MMETSP0449_2-20121227/1720_1 /TAXON_ID=1082188 /ORGANISM="Strombidium rassoulzadegani, Strain ras09" /LENGTH=62 /DNA_ID=CAMNT_0008650609 /DNA_START=998 /DNA_END=1186 /DNA_ORIENTATION=-